MFMARSHNQGVAFPGNLFIYSYRNNKSGCLNRIFVTYKYSLKQTALGQIGFARIIADRIAMMQRNNNGSSPQ
jgi:hypothetical protein